MKKFGLILFVASLGLVACEKNYACTCEEKYTYDNVEYKTEDVYVVLSTKKKQQAACEKKVAEIKPAFENSTITCTAAK